MNFSGRYKDLIHPEKLHVLSLSVLLDKLEETPGGSGANIAYAAALLGEKPILYDAVGQDAKAYMERLSTVGVDTSFVRFSKLPTASFNVMTDIDDNQVGGFYPGAMSDAKGLSLKQWRDQNILVVMSAHDPAAMRSKVGECKQLGLRMVYDPGQQVSNVSGEDLLAGIAAAEVLIVNDYELGALATRTQKTAEDIKAMVPIVITTYGKNGSRIEGKTVESAIKINAAQPEQVLDPTGAGDAYRAGFLYGYLRQWDLLTCGQLGSAVASFVVEQHGTQSQFTKAAVKQRYKEMFNEEITL